MKKLEEKAKSDLETLNQTMNNTKLKYNKIINEIVENLPN